MCSLTAKQIIHQNGKCKTHYFLYAWSPFLCACVDGWSCIIPAGLWVRCWYQLLSGKNTLICSSFNLANIWCFVSVNPLSDILADTPTVSTDTNITECLALISGGPSGWTRVYLMLSDHLAIRSFSGAVMVKSPTDRLLLSAHSSHRCKGLWVLHSSEDCVYGIILPLLPPRLPHYPSLESRLKTNPP